MKKIRFKDLKRYVSQYSIIIVISIIILVVFIFIIVYKLKDREFLKYKISPSAQLQFEGGWPFVYESICVGYQTAEEKKENSNIEDLISKSNDISENLNLRIGNMDMNSPRGYNHVGFIVENLNEWEGLSNTDKYNLLTEVNLILSKRYSESKPIKILYYKCNETTGELIGYTQDEIIRFDW